MDEDWPEPVPGAEHGEVKYALTFAEWESACSEAIEVTSVTSATRSARVT